MNEMTVEVYENSLRRCNARAGFLDRFYVEFLASSPSVRKKFEGTEFTRQKRALRDSLRLMARAAGDPERGPEHYLRDLAARHSRADLDVGSALYDFWLDALQSTVREFDPEYDPEVERAWEEVMSVGIRYLLSQYDPRPHPE
ncbi:globin [bacterium]|nr:globin [bacterium]